MFELRLLDSEVDKILPAHQQPHFAFVDADNVWKSYDAFLEKVGLTSTEKAKFDFFRLFQIISHDRCYIYSATNEATAHPIWLSGLEAEPGFLLKWGELIKKQGGNKQEGVDVKLAIDATRLAYSNIMKTCTLYGADGDFLPLVDAVSDAGTLVNIASFNDPAQGRVAPKLRAGADRYHRMNHMWLYETVSPSHRTVQDYAIHQHGWNRVDEPRAEKIQGVDLEIRRQNSSWMVKLQHGANTIWRGSHNFDDLVIWLKFALYGNTLHA